jgi:hypothetical protein
MHKTKERRVMFLGITLLVSCTSFTLTDLGLILLFSDTSFNILSLTFSFGASTMLRMALAETLSSMSRGDRITTSTLRNMSWSTLVYGIPALFTFLLFPPLISGVYPMVWISNAIDQNLLLSIILVALIYDYPRLLLTLRIRRKKTQPKNTFRETPNPKHKTTMTKAPPPPLNLHNQKRMVARARFALNFILF